MSERARDVQRCSLVNQSSYKGDVRAILKFVRHASAKAWTERSVREQRMSGGNAALRRMPGDTTKQEHEAYHCGPGYDVAPKIERSTAQANHEGPNVTSSGRRQTQPQTANQVEPNEMPTEMDPKRAQVSEHASHEHREARRSVDANDNGIADDAEPSDGLHHSASEVNAAGCRGTERDDGRTNNRGASEVHGGNREEEHDHTEGSSTEGSARWHEGRYYDSIERLLPATRSGGLLARFFETRVRLHDFPLSCEGSVCIGAPLRLALELVLAERTQDAFTHLSVAAHGAADDITVRLEVSQRHVGRLRTDAMRQEACTRRQLAREAALAGTDTIKRQTGQVEKATRRGTGDLRVERGAIRVLQRLGEA